MSDSICKRCYNLEVWPGVFNSRYLCFKQDKNERAFGTLGRDITKGVPEVRRCKSFKEGKHYSVKQLQDMRHNAEAQGREASPGAQS